MNPKTKKILMWVGIALLTLQFVAAASGKLTGAWEENFVRWGYNAAFMYLIGALELLGAVGLFIPKLRAWAAYGLIGMMMGAAYTHLTHDESIRVIHNLLISLIAFGVARFSK